MKTIAVFLIALTAINCIQVQSSAELAFQDKLKALKETSWGRIAVGLLELQLQTGGPMAELVTAFQNLIRDLNFKVGSTQQEYQWDKAEHFELDKQINTRLRDAKVRFGVASAHLQNTLYPQREQLEHLIAMDEQLIDETQHAIDTATRERAEAQAIYEEQVVQHHLALEAVEECQALVRGLLDGSGSFIQMKKAETHIKKLTDQLQHAGPLGHLAAALAEMSQDFADSGAVESVLGLLNDLHDNLVESEANAHSANDQEIAAFEAFLDISWTTIHQAQARVDSNTAALEVCNAEIARQEELRDTAEADRDQAQEELDIETARWDAYVASYEDLIATLMGELDAVDRCIDVFATANLDSDMMDIVDSL